MSYTAACLLQSLYLLSRCKLTQHRQHSRVVDVIDHLGYDFKHFVLKEFIRHVVAQRSKPIWIYTYEFDENTFGFWLPQEEADYIFINKATHPIHRIHNILHEMAHVVLDHPRIIVEHMLPPAFLQILNVKNAEGCARYAGLRNDTPEEREAEEFVFYIQEQVFTHRRSHELTMVGSSIDILRPLLNTSAY